MSINREILDEFYSITNFDIVSYFSSYSSFMKNEYVSIANYFSGKSEKISSQPFKKLDDLLKANEDLFSSYANFKNQLNNYKWWDLISQIEDVQFSLETVKNLSKWLRSPKTNVSYAENVEVEMTLSQYQTLEDFNRDVLSNNEWQDDWVKTAVRNDLKEEDYTVEGGVLLSTKLSSTGSLFINAVVDNISGEKVYGLDIQKKIEISDSDIVVLSYKDTFKQTVDILSTLSKGDNPYRPNDGLDRQSVIGSNVNIVNYPSIFRQMSETFSTDDTIKRFSIKDIRRDKDALFAEFEVVSRIGDASVFQLQLSN